MKRKTISKMLAISILAFTASASQAQLVPVDEWTFMIDMAWDTSATVFEKTNGKTVGKTINGVVDGDTYANEISWGYDFTKNGGNSKNIYTNVANTDPTKARSALVITVPQATGTITTAFLGEEAVAQDANMFRHYNSEISGTFSTLKSTAMTVSVQLTASSGEVVNIPSQTFEIKFYETPNVSVCAWGSDYPSCSGDIFAVISAESMSFTSGFTVNGVNYTLSYFKEGGQFGALPEKACTAMGFAKGECYGFTTSEKNYTDVLFNLSVTSDFDNLRVPEPETYAMMLAGLGLVGIVARRRRNTV
ncbi:MAG: THxN family PEP-CTERM protein [Betaproteobacteria bacterium]|nr:THxN family PEP-CTERM protein [Betaproteobacteria bacterium]